MADLQAPSASEPSIARTDVEPTTFLPTTPFTPTGKPDDPLGPRSPLIGIYLPTYSTQSDESEAGSEIWLLRASFDFAIRYIGQQLPIYQTFEGLPWCTEEKGPRDFVQWTWANSANAIVVIIDKKAVFIYRDHDEHARAAC